MIHSSDRLTHVHSDIRGPLYEEALRMQAAGTEVLKLNTGNPARFGFAIPESVRQATASHLDEAAPYCDVRGMIGARRAICDYHRGLGLADIVPDDIFVCNGVSEAASMLMSALVNTGDEILLPSPCYSLWSNNTWLCGGRPVFYRCAPENGWDPDPEDIERKVTGRTKAIVIINPNNPTGAVYHRDILAAIADIARRHGLVLLSDEIYDRLIMDGAPHVPMGALAPDVPCVTFNGLSKSHIVCGFRSGWMVFSGPAGALDEIKAAVLKLASMRLCGNAPAQIAVEAALADPESTRQMILPGGPLFARRMAVTETLSGIEGVSFVPNRAAFYLFPSVDRSLYDFADDKDLAMRFLHEKHILVIPGSGFDWTEDLRFRIVMLPEPEVLADAMEKFGDFLSHHRK